MKGADRESMKTWRLCELCEQSVSTTIRKVFTNLVLSGSLFAKGLDSRNTDSQVVATDVVELSLLDNGPDVGLLQVLNLVLVGSSKVGAHAAVVAGDNNTTLASGLGLIDTVLGVDTSLLASLLQDVTVLVLTNAANVDDRVVGKHVLCKWSALNYIHSVGNDSFLPEHHGQCSEQHHQGSA